MWNIQKLGAKASGREQGVAVASTGKQPQNIGLQAGSRKLPSLLRFDFPLVFFRSPRG